MKRVAVLAAVVIALLFWLAAGNKSAARRAARERSAPPDTASRAALPPALPGSASSGPALSGPATAARSGSPADAPSASAPITPSSGAGAIPEPKPLPGKSTPAPPPLAGADDPGPGPSIERYEGRSGRLSLNATPAGGEVTTRIRSTGAVPALTVWVPTIRVQAGADVAIHATLTDEQGSPVTPEAIVAMVIRRGAAPAAQQPLAPESDGFALRFKAPAPEAPSNAPAIFEYVVQARGQYLGDTFTRTATGSFLVHSSGGRLDPAA